MLDLVYFTATNTRTLSLIVERRMQANSPRPRPHCQPLHPRQPASTSRRPHQVVSRLIVTTDVVSVTSNFFSTSSASSSGLSSTIASTSKSAAAIGPAPAGASHSSSSSNSNTQNSNSTFEGNSAGSSTTTSKGYECGSNCWRYRWWTGLNCDRGWTRDMVLLP